MTITLDIGMKEENNRLFGVTVILLVEAVACVVALAQPVVPEPAVL